MLIYYLIFGVVFDGKEDHFTTFIFIGLTMWNFFNKNVVQSVNMIKRNKAIVTKVYSPKFVLLISTMMVNGFKMMVSWIIVIIMMICSGVQLSWNVLWSIPVLMVLILFTFAFSIHLLHFGVFVEDLSNVINIAFRLLFYVTGIFYNPMTRFKAPTNKIFTYGNPVAMLLHDMRDALLYQMRPNWKILLIWTVVSVVLAGLGIHQVYKNENSYVKVI